MNRMFSHISLIYMETLTFVIGSTIYGGSFIEDKFRISDVILTKANVGPHMCVRNCLLVNWCNAVTYIRSEMKCLLLHETFPTNALLSRNGYSYTNMDNWQMSDSQCYPNPCKCMPETSQCIETTSLKPICNKLVSKCPIGWVQFDAMCFWYSIVGRSWSQAKVYCESLNSKLAEPMTIAEVNLISAIAQSKGTSSWIGGKRLTDWVWGSNNNTIVTADWGPGEPSGDGPCIHLKLGLNYKWNDVPCSNSYTFFCEKNV